jgi:hypothetical protein
MLAAVRRRLPAEAVFSGATAAWLHGLDVPPCDPVQVTLPPECRVSARSGISVRRARLDGEDIVVRAGFRLLRFTTADVLRAPGSVVRQVRAALVAGR